MKTEAYPAWGIMGICPWRNCNCIILPLMKKGQRGQIQHESCLKYYKAYCPLSSPSYLFCPKLGGQQILMPPLYPLVENILDASDWSRAYASLSNLLFDKRYPTIFSCIWQMFEFLHLKVINKVNLSHIKML